MKSSTYAIVDFWTKIIGIGFIFISGTYALWQYNYAQEREFQKVFYEKQLEVVMELFNTLAELDSEDEKKKIAVDKFWLIYYGKARTFLDHKMFEEIKHQSEYVSVCVMKAKPKSEYVSNCDMKAKPTKYPCNNFSPGMVATSFAIVAREQLSKAWNRSLSDIAEEDPWSTCPDK